MKKVESISIPVFMARGFPPRESPVLVHLTTHAHLYEVTSAALVLTTIGVEDAHAAVSTALIDHKAQMIYSRLCTIGKWVIVIRGGTDVIATMTSGDLSGMKRKLIGYVAGYAALLGLPWLLDQTAHLFDGQEV